MIIQRHFVGEGGYFSVSLQCIFNLDYISTSLFQVRVGDIDAADNNEGNVVGGDTGGQLGERTSSMVIVVKCVKRKGRS